MPARKKNNDYGFTYVILGLILGFFLGSGIVYWYSNRQNGSFLAVGVWNYLAKLFQGNEKSSTYVVSHEDEIDLNYVPPRSLSRQNTPPESIRAEQDTISLMAGNLELRPEAQPADSLNINSLSPDNNPSLQFATDNSLIVPDTLGFTFSAQASMRIAQDRLILIRAYNLPPKVRAATQSQATRQLDSLLGNYPRRNATENMLLVEFWQSPLNFRGYKMSHNKLIVYGIDQVEAFSLHTDGNAFYIKYFDHFYPVSHTFEFKPLTPLEDPVLLEEFQQRWP